MTHSDQESIRQASTGDPAAVERLLVRYLPDLVEYLDRRAARWLRGRESAADLAQSVCREVLVRLRDGRLQFRGEPQFRQWLYRAAVIKLVEKGRLGGAEKRDPAREVPQSHAGPVLSRLPSPSEFAMFHEDLERFQTAFSALGSRARSVISYKLVEGLSHEDIGRQLGVTAAHSRVLLARALAQLAQGGVAP
ncbi:MAG: RNA polymerase sigma factor [Planctomycetes bacterium]|nr:RNA polymerase sigma factor [Planctomycetota bacterium]